jgi:hypothetical protein
VTLTVDGRTLEEDPTSYRVVSPDFTFRAPQGAVYGIPEGVWQAAADGYYVMLAPLSHGPHTIRFTAMFEGQTIMDTTYSLMVSK